MKKVFLFLIMIIISGLLISCSNKAESTKIDHNSIISKESDAIIKSLEPNKGIDDFFQIATVIEELPKEYPNRDFYIQNYKEMAEKIC